MSDDKSKGRMYVVEPTTIIRTSKEIAAFRDQTKDGPHDDYEAADLTPSPTPSEEQTP